jgi:hypothetical protein
MKENEHHKFFPELLIHNLCDVVCFQCHMVDTRLAYVTIEIHFRCIIIIIIIIATRHPNFHQNHSSAVNHCHLQQLHILMPRHLRQCSNSTVVKASKTIITFFSPNSQVTCCYMRQWPFLKPPYFTAQSPYWHVYVINQLKLEGKLLPYHSEQAILSGALF